MGCSNSKSVQVVQAPAPKRIMVHSKPAGHSDSDDKLCLVSKPASAGTAHNGHVSRQHTNDVIVTDVKNNNGVHTKANDDVSANDITKTKENSEVWENDDTSKAADNNVNTTANNDISVNENIKTEADNGVKENDDTKTEADSDVNTNDCMMIEANDNVKQSGDTPTETINDVKENDKTLKNTDNDVKETDDTLQQTENDVKENDDTLQQTDDNVKESDVALKDTDNDVKESDDTKGETTNVREEGDRDRETESGPQAQNGDRQQKDFLQEKTPATDHLDQEDTGQSPTPVPGVLPVPDQVVAPDISPLPPLCPPSQTRDQLIPDPTVFETVDDFAKNVPSTAAESVEELGDYLTSTYIDDLLKLRAIFCWVAFNITYDTDSYFSGAKAEQSGRSVLETGKAVCQGYSQLFEALCKVADVPCVVVSGIAKGFSHDPEDVYTSESKSNHAWNLVYVLRGWWPVDCTWGAGHVDKDRQFNQVFKDHWFLTNPEEFVMRHFPLMNRDLGESANFQLLATPLTLERYSALVRPENLAHVIGLEYVTHPDTIIDVIHDVVIKLKPSRRRLGSFSVTLAERGRDKLVKERSNVLTFLHDDGTCTVYVRPPRVATYLLDVMGQTQCDDMTKLRQLLTYVIRCKETKPDLDPFPQKQDVWGLQNPLAAECGLKAVTNDDCSTPADYTTAESFRYNAKDGEVTVPLQLTRFAKTKVHLRHAVSMNEDLAQYTFTEYQQDTINIRTRLPQPGYYMLRIFASHPDKENLHHAGDLLLHAEDSEIVAGGCQPFPRAFSFAFTERTKLLHPLVGRVPAREPTVYRVKAPTLAEVRLGGQVMELKDDQVWEIEMSPPEGTEVITMFGSVEKDSEKKTGLYQFTVSD